MTGYVEKMWKIFGFVLMVQSILAAQRAHGPTKRLHPKKVLNPT